MKRPRISLFLLPLFACTAHAQTVHGNLEKWSPQELWFEGPSHTELDSNPNPFLDYRLVVSFVGPSGRASRMPGYFDGNGSGVGNGNVWKAILPPDEIGTWTAVASFRAGPEVAISLDPTAGTAVAFDGATIQFDIGPAGVESGALALGRVDYVGGHYLKYKDGGFFLKGGLGSPENFLAYCGFDDTHAGNFGLHCYAQHQGDWNPGDPLFFSNVTGIDGKCIIGALNYLESQQVNSIYFLPMNLGGDGNDTWPFTAPGDPLHYDISKLSQWRQVFDHAAKLGFRLDVVLAETEPANENFLDGGTLGTERKLFYRELAARFSHEPSIKWSLSEECDYSTSEILEFAAYLAAQDASNHAITAHNHPDDLFSLYGNLAGESLISATAVQYELDEAGSIVESLREMSANASHPWAVEMDENMPFNVGLQPGNAAELRKRALWPIYMSGGSGIDWYCGGKDQTLEEFYSREAMWDFMRIARGFLQRHVPFWLCTPADTLLSGESGAFGGGEVLALPGQVYAIYLPDGSPSGTLDLSGEAGLQVRQQWFSPRTGLFEGSATISAGGGPHPLGVPPSDPDDDWVCLLRLAP